MIICKPCAKNLLPQHPAAEQQPVFAEPWQAQAFAITLKLHEQGVFSWREWADCLAAEIAAAQECDAELGDFDSGNSYYSHWLKALERLVIAKGLLSTGELLKRKEAWDHAAQHTPHGQPIVLSAFDL